MIQLTAELNSEFKTIPGMFYDFDDSWTIIKDIESRILKENGDLLCHYKPGALSEDLCRLAIESYLDAGKMISTNRGVAGGMQHRQIGNTFEKGTPVNSNIIGYIDSLNHKRPCRLTYFSKKYFDKYTAGLPFIQEIDKLYKETVPWKYEAQKIATNLAPEFKIADTVFSTVTVNYNFRTALHCDSGDYREGFGNLVVCSRDSTGGQLLFPAYKVAIEMRNGDYLALDVHEFHCNAPIYGEGFRLSFVCYLREKMYKCSEINRVLDSLDVSGNWSTELVFKKIFASIGENVPEKVCVPGTKWWSMTAGRFCLTYKNKRYELYDSLAQKKIHNLMEALKYTHLIFNIGVRSETS